MSFRKSLAVAMLLIAGATIAACSKTENGAAAPSGAGAQVAGHSHEGWWCNEHGVPEEVCALCDTTLIADFKAKGDWCEKHNRPDSQCFACHPDKQAEFAARYEAKYGEQPPKPTDNGGEPENAVEGKQT